MKSCPLLFIIFIFILALPATAQDSLLVKIRIQQVKALYNTLGKQPFLPTDKPLDSLSASWHFYDTAINLFFDRHVMDSSFALETEVFLPEAKFQMMKYTLAGLQYCANRVPWDSLTFSPIMQDENADDEGKNIMLLQATIRDESVTLFYFMFPPLKPRPVVIASPGTSDMDKPQRIIDYINHFPVRE